MSRKQATHMRIAESASHAIREFGYQGVGIADIMREAGLTHGGFYAHFGDRNALITEAIDHAASTSWAALSASMERHVARGASPLKALVVSYLSDSHLACFDAGCPFAALVGEVPRQAQNFQDASRRRLSAFVEKVRSQLAAGTPASAAESLASSLIGSLQMARAIGNNKTGKAFLTARRADLIKQYDRPCR